MTTEGWIALIGALSAAMVGLLTTYRGLTGDKFNRKVSESASLLIGYTTMVEGLRDEVRENKLSYSVDVERIQARHDREMSALSKHHADERAMWERRSNLINHRIAELEGLVAVMNPVNRKAIQA